MSTIISKHKIVVSLGENHAYVEFDSRVPQDDELDRLYAAFS